MEELGADVVPVQGFAEAIELVLQGRADATANDFISFQTYQEEHPDAAFRVLDVDLPTDVTVGVIMQQGQDDLDRSEEHTSELQSRGHLVCRLLLEKKNNKTDNKTQTQHADA